MCPRNAFSTSIIDAGGGIKIEIRGNSDARNSRVGCTSCRFFDLDENRNRDCLGLLEPEKNCDDRAGIRENFISNPRW
jgi:hypothetical protein